MTPRVRDAVILAAGMGTRLQGRGGDRPKGFLCIGERPIVEESIDRLRGAGIEQIIIVTGYRHENYDAMIARHADAVSCVHNPHYADSGSMYSLYCARDRIDGDFLLLESDLIYEPRALSAVLDGTEDSRLLLSGPTGAGDEVWVESRDGFLTGMSKDRSSLRGDVAGELVGITRVSTALFEAMCDWAGRRFARDRHVDYETDCLVAAARVHPLRCHLVADLVWAEIDDPAHLARAREYVYPAISAAD